MTSIDLWGQANLTGLETTEKLFDKRILSLLYRMADTEGEGEDDSAYTEGVCPRSKTQT